jgi:hypothetical protein
MTIQYVTLEERCIGHIFGYYANSRIDIHGYSPITTLNMEYIVNLGNSRKEEIVPVPGHPAVGP